MTSESKKCNLPDKEPSSHGGPDKMLISRLGHLSSTSECGFVVNIIGAIRVARNNKIISSS